MLKYFLRSSGAQEVLSIRSSGAQPGAERSATRSRACRFAAVQIGICLLFLTPAAQAAEVGQRYAVKQGSVEREYYLYAPKADENKPRPLVVVLHGGGGSPRLIAETTGFSELADKQGFVVAYPAGSGRVPTWNAGKCCGYAERTQVDDVGFIEAMIQDIRKRHEIQPTRIYATGLSNGGMMAYRLACDLSGTFAAVAPVAGAMNVTGCKPEGRPALAIFHALDDKQVPYEGGFPTEGLRARIGHALQPDPSIGDAMRFWIKADYCRDFPAHDEQKAYKKVTYFCAEDRQIALYTLKQGGHSWPDKPLNATEEIWRFFRKHPPQEVF